jgi:hypothetical protein
MNWIRAAVAVAMAIGPGCIPADSNIVGASPTAAVACPTACSATQRCVNGACVADGLFRATLTWDRPGDLDLHVVTPAGDTISYRNRSAGGGALDRDDTAGTGPENVYWTATPPLGEYLVCVIPFSIREPTSFVLDARLPSGAVDRRTGTLTAAQSSTTATCSRTSPFLVVTYTISAGVPDAGTPDGGAPDAPAPGDVAPVTDAPATPDLPALPDVGVDVPELPDAGEIPDVPAVD